MGNCNIFTVLPIKGGENLSSRELTATSFPWIGFNQAIVPLLSLYNFDGILEDDCLVLNVGFEVVSIDTCSMVKELINVLQSGFSLGDMTSNSLMDIINQWLIESSTHGKFVVNQLAIDKVSLSSKTLRYHGEVETLYLHM